VEDKRIALENSPKNLN